MKNKVFYFLMIIAICLGFIVIAIKGFNYGIKNSEHQRIEIVLNEEFDIKDMKNIAKEAIKSNVIVSKSTLFGTTAIVEAKDISDEEITNLLDKINEKYSKEYKLKDIKLSVIKEEIDLSKIDSMTDEEVNGKIAEIKEKYDLDYSKEELTSTTNNLRISNVSKVKLFDIVKLYIIPILISLGLILVYFGIRFNKLNKNAWVKEPFKLLFRVILIQLFLCAIVGLCRIPLTEYTIDIMILVLILQIITETIKNEKKLAELKSND